MLFRAPLKGPGVIGEGNTWAYSEFQVLTARDRKDYLFCRISSLVETFVNLQISAPIFVMCWPAQGIQLWLIGSMSTIQ